MNLSHYDQKLLFGTDMIYSEMLNADDICYTIKNDIGGDTKFGKSNQFCGTAIGYSEKGHKLFPKNAGKCGDSVWISGPIGDVAAALDYSYQNGSPNQYPEWVYKSINEPEMVVKPALSIAKKRLANSGTDISDGLCFDLISLCRACDLGVTIELERIPISNNVRSMAQSLSIPDWIYALMIGGDFQLLVSAPNMHSSEMGDLGFTNIGKLTKMENGYFANLDNGRRYSLPEIGHNDMKATNFLEELQLIKAELLQHFEL